MASVSKLPLAAVDVGNSRIKLGVFEHPLAEPLPHPHRALAVEPDKLDDLAAWLPEGPERYNWAIASVNRPSAARLQSWLAARQVTAMQMLSHTDLPIDVEVPRADKVGLDRLAGAVAANRLRAPDEKAIVIGLGSAITVDLISASGAFEGGAILPGTSMSGRALHEFTDLLPLVEVAEPPPVLGKSTLSAISSGLYWGTVGALRELVTQLSEGEDLQVFFTGGAAPLFASIFEHQDARRPAQFVPHLTLAGVALAALHAAESRG